MSKGGMEGGDRPQWMRSFVEPAPVVVDLINSRTLERETFSRSVEMLYPHVSVAAFASVQDWRDRRNAGSSSIVLYNAGAQRISDADVASSVGRIVELARPTPVIILAESEEIREMIAAIDAGAVGYLPASIGLDLFIEATELTCTGGIFLPLGSLDALRSSDTRPDGDVVPARDDTFTSRQSAVAEALRQGKANKIIGFELKMSESTVKVHVRNIMKKLGATNRTEAAFKLNLVARQE